MCGLYVSHVAKKVYATSRTGLTSSVQSVEDTYTEPPICQGLW